MPADLDATAFKLFKLFAQCEYALKAMGYLRAGRNDAAEADWDRFAGAHGGLLLVSQEPSVITARDFLFNAPPKRQVVVNGSVDWAPVDANDRSVHALFGHIRRVRNNLYHGGKFNGRWLQPERSLPLMESALVLLEALRQGIPELSRAIADNAA